MTTNRKTSKHKADPVKDTTSGGLNDYYLAWVEFPQRENQPPYVAECEDIIEALQLTWDEGNILKEIWRTAKGRAGAGKPSNTTKRAADKILHYAKRNQLKASRG